MPVHLIKPIQIILAILGLLISVAWGVFWIFILKTRWSNPRIGSINLGKGGVIFFLILGMGILAGSIWMLVSVINQTEF